MIKNGCIKNWSPVFGQTCHAWNRLRPEGYGIEVTPVCPGTGRNFDNRVAQQIAREDITVLPRFYSLINP